MLSIPTIILLGSAKTLEGFTLFNSVLWLLFGIITSMVGILTGLFANQQSRGLTFGMMGAARSLGQVIGVGIAGPLITYSGFAVLCAVDAGVYLLLVAAGLALADMHTVQRQQDKTELFRRSRLINLLFAASLIAAMVSYANTMMRPLAMQQHGLTPTTITTILAFSALVNLPIPFLMGWLADHVGRRLTLLVCYGLMALGAALMLAASEFWHFWLAQVFVTIVVSSTSVTSALITDLVPKEQVSKVLGQYSAVPWAGAVLAFLAAGLAMDNVGLSLTFLGVVILAIGAVLIVVRTLPTSGIIATQLMVAVQIPKSAEHSFSAREG